MASQKVRPTVLQLFFRISTYIRYAFAPEKQLPLGGRNFCLAIFICFVLALSGCQSTLLKKVQMNEFSEELYIDAKLNFAIKHPVNWKRVKIPVSSPKFKADTVRWQIENPRRETDNVGNMLIQSLPNNKKADLPDLLSNFLADKPELKSGQAERFEHSAGSALKFLGRDVDRGRLTIAMKGQQQDFIISLDYPNNRFEELLPVFQDIVASFSELIRPDSYPKSAPK
ncbi:MAG: hypothetical protein U9Q61_06595 [Thermodesulfobacteriota bacterium]|nr:hypothetical protein [Thermodesulfobacteriota bacterium]